MDFNLLETPCAFFAELLQQIRTSRQRIILSALYLGASLSHEKQLLDCLIEALDRVPDLELGLIFDYSRSTRRDQHSCITALTELVRRYPNRVSTQLYKMPQIDRLPFSLPTPLDEMIAVYHLKFMVFDSNVLLTGANLSEEYFTSRQDRYFMFKDATLLATFLAEIAKTISMYAHKLTDSGCFLPPELPHSNEEAARLRSVLNSYCSAQDSSFAFQKNFDCVFEEKIKAADAKEDTKEFIEVIPLLQYADQNICDESVVVIKLLEERKWTKVSC